MTALSAPSPTQNTAPLQRLAVISNGASTHNVREQGWIEPYLVGPGIHHFHGHGPEGIRKAVAQAAAINAEVIVVNGGDGTTDVVFSALLNDGPFATLPALALLPAGKTNMTAAAWSLNGDKRDAIARLLAAWRGGSIAQHIHRRPILTVERSTGEAPLRGAFLGAADVVNGILFCRKHIYPLKLPNVISHSLAVGVLLWRGLFTKTDTLPLRADMDGVENSESGRFFVVSASTLDELILGFTPQPSIGSGPMNYMSLRSGVGTLLRSLPYAFTKKVPAGNGRTVRKSGKITLHFDGAYTLDGELYESTRDKPLTISATQTLPIIRLVQP
ncbi:MAG: hypothetical protein EXR11_00650 [Rhodospirillaceae bacterium]|nr:hypothetical protein [Rhodospirillaceae bacterium]